MHGSAVQEGMHTSDGSVELTKGVSAGELMVVHGIEPLLSEECAEVKLGASLTEQQALITPDAGVASAPLTPNGSGSTGSASTGSGM